MAAPPQAPIVAFAAPYAIVNNRPVIMNAYGFPRAQPLFPKSEFVYNSLYGYPDVQMPCESCQCHPGPSIPAHWWDGGSSWVTNYFTSLQPYDPKLKQPGSFQCNIPTPQGTMCAYQVHNPRACESCPCFCPSRDAPLMMKKHLIEAHGFREPKKREWATGLCETTGCCDVIFCTACLGARQLMAVLGHVNQMSWLYCIMLCLAGCDSETETDADGNQKTVITWTPPCILAALLTRPQVVTLQNIDENCCCTGIKAVCCSCCALAQHTRELSAAGVWPGGPCGGSAPPVVVMKPAVIDA